MEKAVVKVGKGLYSPNAQSRVLVSLVGKWQTVEGAEHIFDKRENYPITIDEAIDPLSQCLEDVICSMKADEECEIKLKLDRTLVTSELLKNTPFECVVSYTIHLISFERAPEVWSLSEQRLQEIALWHKAKGTELFKAGNIYGAALHYSKALKYAISSGGNTSTTEASATEVTSTLKKVLYSNLAACQLKLKLYPNVSQNCTCVLEEGIDVKALYRRGQALAATNDFEGARKDFLKALEVEPNNTAVQKQLRDLETKARTHDSKMGSALKEMFR